MRGKSPDKKQLDLFSQPLEEIINPKHPLFKLSNIIPWDEIENDFQKLYSHTGRPSKPIRQMVALLILKQLYDLSDETVVEHWIENPYYQYFGGEMYFQWELPCDPTDLVLFRKRIGERGVEKILQMSINLHGKKAKEKEVLIDTTVQEKNITFPTDSKLHSRIIDHCVKISKEEGVSLRQSYRRTKKKLILAQRNANHPRNRKRSRAARRKLKTIAGRLVREIQRKLPSRVLKRYADQIDIFEKVLSQTKTSKNKIYSIHEPQVYCISKGKEHKKYEFGAKASIVLTKNNGIIVGALSIPENKYDGHTLPEVINQASRLMDKKPKFAICDRGYRGKSIVDEVKILIPKRPGKTATRYEKEKARKRFRRRAGIEPVIGHLKSDFKLARNYLKGFVGDNINIMLAAAAFNIKKFMKELRDYFFCSCKFKKSNGFGSIYLIFTS